MKKIYILLFLMVFLAGIFFRLYEIGIVPSSLNWDEVSWGFNAYSILKTGHDEHGVLFPSSFMAFGDFKQPVYVYLSSITIALFGLNPIGVRLPSAILGILTIPFVWLFVYEYFKKDKHRFAIALLVTALFSLSPWSIQFSRVAYEANIGLFFTISGVALFFRGLNMKKPLYFLVATFLLAVSCYSYHSQKLFTPLLFVGLLTHSYFNFKISKRFLLTIFALFVLFNLLWIVDPRTTSRGRSVTFYSNQTEILKSSTRNIIYDSKNGDFMGSILENRRIIYFNKYFENYLSHFNPNYLFITGDNARHHAYGMGVILLVSLPFILLGFFTMHRRKMLFILFWFLIAPLASSLAVDAPNASRSLVFLPTWYIFEALGLLWILSLKKVLRNGLIAIIFACYLLNYIYYVHNYFMHTNNIYGIYWQSGYKEAVMRAHEYEKSGSRVFFDPSFEQAYIFYLFYNQYDPAKYLASGGSDRIKNKCFTIDNAFFGECSDQIKKGDIVLSIKEEETNKLKKIEALSGQENEAIYEAL